MCAAYFVVLYITKDDLEGTVRERVRGFTPNQRVKQRHAPV